MAQTKIRTEQIENLATGDIVSGTFADARIAESNVTQHQGAIDHDQLTNFVANEHIDWTGASSNFDTTGTGTFADVLTVDGNATNAGRLRLAEDTDNGTNYVEVISPSAVTANRTQTLQDSDGTIALTSDLHDAVTLAGTPDYLTLSGQEITLTQIDLTTDITGNLPVTNLADDSISLGKLSNQTGPTFVGRVTGTGALSALSQANILTTIGDAGADGSTKGVASFNSSDFSASSGNISLATTVRTKANNFKTKAITIEDPTSSEDITMFFTDDAITVTQLNAVLANGSSTPSVTWTIRHSTDRSATGNEVVTSGTTTTSISTGSEVSSFNDATIPAGSWVWIETTAQSGTVPELSVSIEYTVD